MPLESKVVHRISTKPVGFSWKSLEENRKLKSDSRVEDRFGIEENGTSWGLAKSDLRKKETRP
jgi:hypothetical protein